MKAAGYNVVYKGKWHCSKPAKKEDAQPSDLEKYGFLRWNPPDAGANQTVPEAGGGYIDNDGRFIEQEGTVADGTEGALQYLSSSAAQQQPFFMVISVVNPHDVLFYPSKSFDEAGYDGTWLEGNIQPAGDRRRRPLDQAHRSGTVPQDLQPDRQAEEQRTDAQLPQLLRQPDALL